MSSRIEILRNSIESELDQCQSLDLIIEWEEDFEECENSKQLTQFYKKVKIANKNKIKNNSEARKLELQNEIKNMIPFFREEFNPTIFTDLEDPEKSTKLITGLVQSGKSAVICGLTIYMIEALKKHVIIILRDFTADYLQLSRKFLDGGEFSKFDIPVLYARDCDGTAIFSSKNPALTICIEHQAQLGKIVEILGNFGVNSKPDFCLIADEADAICYKKDTDKERIGFFRQIQKKASQFIGVTATTFDMLFLESKLKNKSIYRVPVEGNYKGIDHPDFSITELTRLFDFKLKLKDGQYVLSKDMEEFYHRLCDEEKFDNAIKETKEEDVYYEDHPVICLQKTESTISKQQQSLSALINHPRFSQEFALIVYNGDGILVYHKDGLPESITGCVGRPFQNQYVTIDQRVVHYTSIGIGDVLQALKDKGDEKYSHIVIIAGKMVGRGINICSNDYKWHLTHQILSVSTTATCSDITQSCRLFGKYNDSIPTRLFCLQKDAMSLKQTHFLQNRILEGADLHEVTENMRTLCDEIAVFVGHIPKRTLTRKCKQPEFNKVATIREQYGEVEEEVEERKESDRDRECIRQINSVSGISQIIRYFLTNGKMKLIEFVENCKELFGIEYNASFFSIGKYTKHGVLLVKDNEGNIDVHEDYRRNN
jgi:hypothetical protein